LRSDVNDRPKRRNQPLTPAQRAFAEHYAKHGDWVEALHHAYPTSLKWKSESKHGTIARLRSHPLVRDVIDEIRRPALVEQQIDFGWLLREARDVYTKLKALPDIAANSRELRAWQKHMARMVGVHAGFGDERPTRPPLPGPAEGAVIDGEFHDLDSLPTDRLLELAGGSSAGDLAAPGPAVIGEAGLERFRDLLRGAPTSEAPPDAVHGPADGDRGAPDEVDGVHAAGGSEVDLLQRVRARLRGRENAGHCPHCGQPHDGPCPGVR